MWPTFGHLSSMLCKSFTFLIYTSLSCLRSPSLDTMTLINGARRSVRPSGNPLLFHCWRAGNYVSGCTVHIHFRGPPCCWREGRLHRLSTLQFIPSGADVPRVLIHLPSLILRRQGSWVQSWSIIMTPKLAQLCSPLVKCSATGESSVLWCAMLKQWLFIWM